MGRATFGFGRQGNKKEASRSSENGGRQPDMNTTDARNEREQKAEKTETWS